MSSPIKITLTQARRIALNASLLYGQTKLPKGKEGVEAVINHLGYIQIDTISVIARAHHHTLWTRCRDYNQEYLHQLQAEDRSIFEYWGHAMSYLPMDDYRFYKHSFKRFLKPTNSWTKTRLENARAFMPNILKRIKNEGGLGSKDFKDNSLKKNNRWWDWKPAKTALEFLYWQGKLMITERQNFHRLYDLTERVLPSHINTDNPTDSEQAQFWIFRALQSLGIATVSEIKEHLYHSDKTQIEKQLQQLISTSQVIQIEISGLSGTYYVLTENFENIYPIKKRTDKLHILSPFDNTVINRARLQKLFDFQYTIECYVPKPKRKFGYFVLPILWGDKFVGRLDAKADRKAAELIIHNIYIESSFQPNEAFTLSLGKKLQSFAKFNNCRTISLSQTDPNSFRKELSKEI